MRITLKRSDFHDALSISSTLYILMFLTFHSLKKTKNSIVGRMTHKSIISRPLKASLKRSVSLQTWCHQPFQIRSNNEFAHICMMSIFHWHQTHVEAVPSCETAYFFRIVVCH